MAYTAIIETLDRLSVKSVLRGSTATIAGIVGTLVLILLCLAIYVPPTSAIMDGVYTETQFYTQSIASQPFYANDDFKILVVFRNKMTNKIVNHSEILKYSEALAQELYADFTQLYDQPMRTCADDPHYFDNVKDAPKLDDCFLFPEFATFQIFKTYSFYTFLYFNLFPKDDPDPFSNAGNRIQGYRYQLQQLLQKNYYQVLFTSKIIDANGNEQFIIHRFYSTDSEPTSLVGTSWNQITLNIRNTSMDLSIMPWRNSQNHSNIIWLGQILNQGLLTIEDAARQGVDIYFSQDKYQIRSFRYYKKVDFLLGIIGGAMLLFYLILWVPFNYINRTIHQMRNTEKLLLINKAKEDEPVLTEDLFMAKVPWNYWISNPILDNFFPKLKEASDLVMQGERELDVVSLIKKLKVAERTLDKRNILQQFKPKVLLMKENNSDQSLINLSVAEQSQVIESETGTIVLEQNLQVREQDFKEEEVDDKFQLTDKHLNFVQNSGSGKKLFTHSIAAGALRKEDNSELKEFQSKNKWSAHYDTKVKISLPRKAFNKLCEGIEWFDLFGARPNLNAGASGSSFLGLCGVMTIILLTCLTVGLTISNSNTPIVMILQQFQPESNFGFRLTPGIDLKFAVCSNYIKYLQGANRFGYFRFYYENSAGRVYLNPTQLTSAEYSLFDITKSTSPIDITYCFKMTANSSIFLGKTPTDYGYFGFRIEPYCASTPGYCNSTATTVTTNFVSFMNNAQVLLFLPENRFNPDKQKFINNLVLQQLNINTFYMNNHSSMEETLYVDQVRIEDDTKNFFMRRMPNITFQGIAADANTPYPLSRMFNSSSLYYELRIKPSSKQINYLVSTPKADTILGIIGGVIVIWYSLCHWLGKVYNNYQIRATQADAIYGQDGIDQNIIMKLIAISPIPLCLLPKCSEIRNTITRMRQVDRKIVNDLNYLWLVKYINNIFDLSYSLFDRSRAQHLSKVFVKEKIDESQNVVQVIEVEEKHQDEDFMDFELLKDDRDLEKDLKETKSNKVANESSEKVFVKQMDEKEKELPMTKRSNARREEFSENYMDGHPKPLKFGWMDTFEYQPSLTFKGKREVTSCCGGFCCLIMLMFILVVVNFELGIYLNRSDTKIGMTTSVMQPLQANSNPSYNSDISLTTGAQFKLGVTFSSTSEDIPHNISNYITNGIGISIFQAKYVKVNGTLSTSVLQYPMLPCQAGYFTKAISTIVDPAYYSNEQYGFCAPDGIALKISGLPEDSIRQSFTLSVYNKYNSTAANLNIKNLLNNYFPKFHFTVPNMDNKEQAVTYEFTSLVFDPYNITTPVQQNISLSKLVISYDDDIGFTTKPKQLTTYNVNPFQQMQVYYTGLPSQALYYNLTFDNSFLVETYTITGDKFYETFGVVGGLIAFFVFGFACIPRAFNKYRMQYLIGRELYLFEIAKKKHEKNRQRGKVKKSRQQRKQLSDINNMSQGMVLRAYFFSLIGSVWQNYNIDPILRRVSLIQQRVENDLSLVNVYKKLHSLRDTLNDQFQNAESVKPADVFLKHIYNSDPQETHMQHLTKIKNLARRYGWTAYEQFAISEAYAARINLRDVFDNAFLSRAFDLETEATVANLSVLNGSMGTESAVASEMMSRNEDD